ncbi:MAG: cache domain-containing protein, partial [Deltaproteobacteria bacterium]|nr:cache domain-containing protein [Deltaproteobacteria bacterium]
MRGLAALRRRLIPSLRRAVLLLPVSILLPLLLAETWVFVSWYRAQHAHMVDSNLEVARAGAANFDTFLADVLRQELTLGNILHRSGSPELRKQVLAAAAAEYPSVVNLLWVAPSGRVILTANARGAGPEPLKQPYFRKLLSGWDWAVSGVPARTPEDRPVFFVARAIRNREGGLRGIVTAVIDPAKLGEVLAIDRPGGGAVLLVDDTGMVVYRYPEVTLSWAERLWFSNVPALRKVLEGQEAVFTAVSPIDSRSRIFGAAPVSLARWAVAASRPSEEALGPLARVLPQSAILFAAAVALALALAYGIGRLVRRPVQRLEAHAR